MGPLSILGSVTSVGSLVAVAKATKEACQQVRTCHKEAAQIGCRLQSILASVEF